MRASPRPPWRTLLLALLLAAGGCTTGPAPQRPAGGTTAPAPQPSGAGTTAPVPQRPDTMGPAPVELDGIVGQLAGYSAGLVTVIGLTGQRRPDPGTDGRRIQLAVLVTATNWVGELPARVWIPRPARPSCMDCLDPLDWFRVKGTRWVVTVRDTDAEVVEALRVRGGKVWTLRQVGLGPPESAAGRPRVVEVDLDIFRSLTRQRLKHG